MITEMMLEHLLKVTNKYDISPEEKENIPLASALHDIGKIAIPDAILNKPEQLTAEEMKNLRL